MNNTWKNHILFQHPLSIPVGYSEFLQLSHTNRRSLSSVLIIIKLAYQNEKKKGM